MKPYKLIVMDTPKKKLEGVRSKSFLSVNHLYLFPKVNEITMKGVKFPVKLLFLNEDADIINIVLAQPEKEYLDKSAHSVIECSPFFNSINLKEIHEKIIKAIGK
jgi:uncharacterized membrane protein (UPF0127 family)